jgi:AGZA family xanthine/uracil permease-like MFS transporter
MPLAVAPAMGVNAYFTYNVVGYLGTGRVTYKQALAAVFVEGFIFLFLTVSDCERPSALPCPASASCAHPALRCA